MRPTEKYFYNTRTLQYEKVEYSSSKKIYNIIGFISACVVTSFIFLLVLGNYWETPKTRLYKSKITKLDSKYEQLSEIVEELKREVLYLEKRDNEIYRIIFQASNIDDSLRELDTKQEDIVYSIYYHTPSSELYDKVETSIYKLRNRIRFQRKSYLEIDNLIRNKEDLFKSTPAIQPISNDDLSKIASGFGYRIDPIYKTEKFHEGLDFSAPTNTPIYATADGVIEKKEFNGGYGNYVIINHGFGYETLYAHMSDCKCRVGQKVKRGEVIGFVGNTGKSVGPHCHYEVKKNGVKVNPVYYFFSDLSAEQFQKIIVIANQKNQSID